MNKKSSLAGILVGFAANVFQEARNASYHSLISHSAVNLELNFPRILAILAPILALLAISFPLKLEFIGSVSGKAEKGSFVFGGQIFGSVVG